MTTNILHQPATNGNDAYSRVIEIADGPRGEALLVYPALVLNDGQLDVCQLEYHVTVPESLKVSPTLHLGACYDAMRDSLRCSSTPEFAQLPNPNYFAEVVSPWMAAAKEALTRYFYGDIDTPGALFQQVTLPESLDLYNLVDLRAYYSETLHRWRVFVHVAAGVDRDAAHLVVLETLMMLNTIHPGASVQDLIRR